MRLSRARIVVVAVIVGLVTAGCSWGQVGGDASRAGYVPLETGITVANVSQLQLSSWTGLNYSGA